MVKHLLVSRSPDGAPSGGVFTLDRALQPPRGHHSDAHNARERDAVGQAISVHLILAGSWS
jgi:hypothetical protein